jgi:hypothetical protein
VASCSQNVARPMQPIVVRITVDLRLGISQHPYVDWEELHALAVRGDLACIRVLTNFAESGHPVVHMVIEPTE